MVKLVEVGAVSAGRWPDSQADVSTNSAPDPWAPGWGAARCLDAGGQLSGLLGGGAQRPNPSVIFSSWVIAVIAFGQPA
jgi:hypothetical protein